MFLVDTNVVSELRKGPRADPGVVSFFQHCQLSGEPLYLSVITLGELRCGVERIRVRGDHMQAQRLESWLKQISKDFSASLLPIDAEIAEVWGRLRAPHHENAIDKLIAATALVRGLTVVTRNTKDFRSSGVPLLDPFQP